jgi:hypothetical protein
MKPVKQDRRAHMVGLWATLGILFLLVTQSCQCLKGCALWPSESTPEPEAVIQRRLEKVWTGPGDLDPSDLPELDDDWHVLASGDLVTTDDRGVGCVKFRGCMEIFIFRKSKLKKSACSKSNLTSGNVTCAEEGTAGFNNRCASQIIIQTDSAQITLSGTLLRVSYFPDQELTVIRVREGSASVQPVLDAEAYTLGDADDVQAGQSWFTVPDTRLPEIAGLPVRKVLDALPPPIEEQLQPWEEQVQLWVRTGDVLTPTPAPEPSTEAPAAIEVERVIETVVEVEKEVETVVEVEKEVESVVEVEATPSGGEVWLVSGGGPFEDAMVREAVRYAVPWAELAERAFPDGDVPIVLAWVPEKTLVAQPDIADMVEHAIVEVPDARDLDHDSEQARALMEAAGYDDFDVVFLYPGDDEALDLMAPSITNNLTEVGIVVPEPETLALEDVLTPADQLMARRAREGVPVLLLRWR